VAARRALGFGLGLLVGIAIGAIGQTQTDAKTFTGCWAAAIQIDVSQPELSGTGFFTSELSVSH
jgi:hypothetical protein